MSLPFCSLWCVNLCTICPWSWMRPTFCATIPWRDIALHNPLQRRHRANHPRPHYPDPKTGAAIRAGELRIFTLWLAEGSIPYAPLPKRGAWSEARFLRSEIVEWMRKRTVKPIRVPHGVVNAQTA
jgi:hypothetical protein